MIAAGLTRDKVIRCEVATAWALFAALTASASKELSWQSRMRFNERPECGVRLSPAGARPRLPDPLRDQVTPPERHQNMDLEQTAILSLDSKGRERKITRAQARTSNLFLADATLRLIRIFRLIAC